MGIPTYPTSMAAIHVTPTARGLDDSAFFYKDALSRFDFKMCFSILRSAKGLSVQTAFQEVIHCYLTFLSMGKTLDFEQLSAFHSMIYWFAAQDATSPIGPTILKEAIHKLSQFEKAPFVDWLMRFSGFALLTETELRDLIPDVLCHARPEIIEFLIKNRCFPNAMKKEWGKSLARAILSGNRSMMLILLSLPAYKSDFSNEEFQSVVAEAMDEVIKAFKVRRVEKLQTVNAFCLLIEGPRKMQEKTVRSFWEEVCDCDDVRVKSSLRKAILKHYPAAIISTALRETITSKETEEYSAAGAGTPTDSVKTDEPTFSMEKWSGLLSSAIAGRHLSMMPLLLAKVPGDTMQLQEAVFKIISIEMKAWKSLTSESHKRAKGEFLFTWLHMLINDPRIVNETNAAQAWRLVSELSNEAMEASLKKAIEDKFPELISDGKIREDISDSRGGRVLTEPPKSSLPERAVDDWYQGYCVIS